MACFRADKVADESEVKFILISFADINHYFSYVGHTFKLFDERLL